MVSCITCKQPITWTGFQFRCKCPAGVISHIRPADMPKLVEYMAKADPPARKRPVVTTEVEL